MGRAWNEAVWLACILNSLIKCSWISRTPSSACWYWSNCHWGMGKGLAYKSKLMYNVVKVAKGSRYVSVHVKDKFSVMWFMTYLSAWRKHTHLVLAAGCGCHNTVIFSVCFRPVLRVVVYSWPLTGLCGMTKTRRYVHMHVCGHACMCVCVCVYMHVQRACKHVCMPCVFQKMHQ